MQEFTRDRTITDDINLLGNFTLPEEEKKTDDYKTDDYKTDDYHFNVKEIFIDDINYNKSKNIINTIVQSELDVYLEKKQEDFIDDYMYPVNYVNPDYVIINNLDLGFFIEKMTNLKKSIKLIEFKIMYYKKLIPEFKYKEHELNIKRYEDNLVKAKKELKKLE